MARKVDDKPAALPPAAQRTTAPEDELRILAPDVDLVLAGEPVTVREYDFFQSMEIVYGDRAFLDDVMEAIAGNTQDVWEVVRSLFGKHQGFLKRAACASVDKPVEWLATLRAKEQDRLMSTWWAVNGHFFLHEATVVLRGRISRIRLDGPTSSSSSPTLDSATSAASDATPSDS